MTATQPVETPGMKMRVATQPLEAPGAKIATQPIEAPSARSEVLSQPTSTSSVDLRPVDQSLTFRKTIAAANTGVSDSEDDLHSKPESPAAVSDQGDLSDRNTPKDKELGKELSEEANYRETMRGVRLFMCWYQIPDFDSSSSSLAPLLVLEPSPLGRYRSNYQQMSGFAQSLKN